MSDKRIATDEKEVKNFIENIIAEDLKSKKHDGRVTTRFPPEPNGYLHIGHAKAICLNFNLALDNVKGVCHLRFDDTNPEKEDEKYALAIMEDIKWLGFDWGEHLYHSSDYFERIYQYSLELINKGLAYVDCQTADEIREQRGTLTESGKESPFRNRSIEENLDFFQRMRAGEFKDGEKVLRAKIDMSSGNINLRDPVLYRIRHIAHQRTGNDWCIYPMYDFTHALSDAIEDITHSLCSLEFEDHRPLYDWCVENVSITTQPRQIEFSRLNLDYTVMSKRFLRKLVEENYVDGWNDPRMPTISGMRRRGYPPEAIRNFCQMVGISKKNTIIEYGLLEESVRECLNASSKRVMGVVDPIKVTIRNWEDGRVYKKDAPFHPKDESFGRRELCLANGIYIDRSDFLEEPPSPKKWFRLGPGRSVRLRYACVITCVEYKKDADGNVEELVCDYVEDSFDGKTPEGMKKVKGIIHWVNQADAVDVEVRLYDRLFSVENPMSQESDDYTEYLNQNSLQVQKAKVEPSVANSQKSECFQFERTGYFVQDESSQKEKLVYNKIVSLKDSWVKVDKK